jgi:hypothetical protein
MYRAGSLLRIAKVTPKYQLHFVEVQEVRWNRSGTEPAGEYTISMEREMRIMN